LFVGASVIVCQGADLLAIRPRRPPPRRHRSSDREMSWTTAVIHEKLLGSSFTAVSTRGGAGSAWQPHPA